MKLVATHEEVGDRPIVFEDIFSNEDLPPIYDESTEDGFLIVYENQNSTKTVFDTKSLISLLFDELGCVSLDVQGTEMCRIHQQ